MSRAWWGRAAAVVAVLALAASGGCAGERPAGVAPSAAAIQAPRPAGVQDPASLPPSEEPAGSCEPRASLRPAADGPTVAKIQARGRLVAGVSQNAYQLGFRDPITGELAGFEIDLVRFVNRVLERIRQDGTWQAMHRRWLSGLGPTPPPPAPRYRD